MPCHTYAGIKDALEQAGFERVGLAHDGQQMDSLVEAFRP